jgi:hypothetical protein
MGTFVGERGICEFASPDLKARWGIVRGELEV